jgi:hypothetical protein
MVWVDGVGKKKTPPDGSDELPSFRQFQGSAVAMFASAGCLRADDQCVMQLRTPRVRLMMNAATLRNSGLATLWNR